MQYDLGYIDLEQRTLQTSPQPLRPGAVTHVLGTIRYRCLRSVHRKSGAGEGIRTLDPNLVAYSRLLRIRC
jgi:hypothetical protein